MDFANAVAREGASRQTTGVDPSLYLDMRSGLALEVAEVIVDYLATVMNPENGKAAFRRPW